MKELLRMPAPRATASLSTMDLHVGFVAAGMATTLLGPVLPALSQRWSVTDAQIGLVFTVQFLGTVTMSALSSALVIRMGGGRVMLVGFVLLAAGIGGLTVAPWEPGLAAILCYGLGLGLVLPTTNVLIAAASPGREASAVSLVNVSWSGGAVAWPVLVAYAGGGQRVGLPLAVLALVMALMASRLVLTARHGAADGSTAVSSAMAIRALNRGGELPALPADHGHEIAILVATFGAMLFFYAGVESAIGGWVAEHVRRIENDRAGRLWTIAPMVFWAALAMGRLVTPLVLRGLAEPRVLVVALTVVLAASTGLTIAASVPQALVAAAVVGLALGPVFPITFVDLTHTLGPRRPGVVGPVYAMATIGSAVLPWLVGFCSTRFGTLRAGLVVPVVSAIAMIALTAIRLMRQPRERD
jgi:MFS transporter, FHS family, glucose/mannose:H+ symporter